MELDIIYKALVIVLTGAVGQNMYYAWKAQQAKERLQQAVLEALRQGLTRPSGRAS